MSDLELLGRLKSYKLGIPQPRTESINIPLETDGKTLFMSFVKMGGEMTAWGIAYKIKNEKTKYFTILDPRKRELLPSLYIKFWNSFKKDVLSDNKMPLIWVPNDSHIEMFQSIALRFTRFRQDETEDSIAYKECMQAMHWLFRCSERPGQTAIVSASRALRESFYFPADKYRQAHIGYLNALLEKKSTKELEQIEKKSISTGLDPIAEEYDLVPYLIEDSTKPKQFTNEQKETAVNKIIERELATRINQTENAFLTLQKDMRELNPGLIELRNQTTKYFTDYFPGVGEPKYLGKVNEDRKLSTASKNFRELDELGDYSVFQLLKFDGFLQKEANANGDAIIGKLTKVTTNKIQRKTEIFWEIETDNIWPLRIREGENVCFTNYEKSSLEVLSIDEIENKRIIRLSVLAPKTTKSFDMTNKDLIGTEICLIKKPFGIFYQKPPTQIYGQWLYNLMENAGVTHNEE